MQMPSPRLGQPWLHGKATALRRAPDGFGQLVLRNKKETTELAVMLEGVGSTMARYKWLHWPQPSPTWPDSETGVASTTGQPLGKEGGAAGSSGCGDRFGTECLSEGGLNAERQRAVMSPASCSIKQLQTALSIASEAERGAAPNRVWGSPGARLVQPERFKRT
jgi:hypothetical protein